MIGYCRELVAEPSFPESSGGEQVSLQVQHGFLSGWAQAFHKDLKPSHTHPALKSPAETSAQYPLVPWDPAEAYPNIHAPNPKQAKVKISLRDTAPCTNCDFTTCPTLHDT